MENHLEQQETPEPRRQRSFTDLVLGAIVALLFAGAVVVGAIAGGSYAFRHLEEPAFEAAAIGLIVGGLVALLFWPLFDVA